MGASSAACLPVKPFNFFSLACHVHTHVHTGAHARTLTHTHSLPAPAFCYLGGESAPGELGGRIQMGYSQGFGFLLLLLFSFSPYSSHPMKSWTLKSKLRNTKGGAVPRYLLSQWVCFRLPRRQAQISSGQWSFAESSQCSLDIKGVVFAASTVKPPSYPGAREQSLGKLHPPNLPRVSWWLNLPHHKHSIKIT